MGSSGQGKQGGDAPAFLAKCGSGQTIAVSIEGGVVTVSITGGEPAPPSGHLPPPDDLTRERSRRALTAIGYLLTRQEAAAYTRRSVQTFDRFLRHQLRNAGTPARPLFLKEDIDRCLQNLPSPGTPSTTSANTPVASTGASGSPTRGFVTRSRQAKVILEKLRRGPPTSTGE